MPSSSCRKAYASDIENDASTAFDHRDTDDDDDQLVESCTSSPYGAVTRTEGSCRTGDCDHPTSYNTTCVVIERSASMCDYDDSQLLASNECNITLQQSAAPESS